MDRFPLIFQLLEYQPRVNNVFMRAMAEMYHEERLTAEFGPMLRPTRRDYDRVMAPQRRREHRAGMLRKSMQRQMPGKVYGQFVR